MAFGQFQFGLEMRIHRLVRRDNQDFQRGTLVCDSRLAHWERAMPVSLDCKIQARRIWTSQLRPSGSNEVSVTGRPKNEKSQLFHRAGYRSHHGPLFENRTDHHATWGGRFQTGEALVLKAGAYGVFLLADSSRFTGSQQSGELLENHPVRDGNPNDYCPSRVRVRFNRRSARRRARRLISLGFS